MMKNAKVKKYLKFGILTMLMTISTQSSFAKKYTYALKNYPIPSRGCLSVNSVSTREARRALRLQNFTTEGATEQEVRTIGAAFKWLQHLNDGPLRSGTWDKGTPYPIIVKEGTGYSGQRWDHILIQRQGSKEHGLSVAQHVHEYSHFIGNRGGYGAYRAHMRGHGLCMVSNYADNNQNEQFAEVFTAFATEPAILLNNPQTRSACRHAFNFFKEWFDAGHRVNECM